MDKLHELQAFLDEQRTTGGPMKAIAMDMLQAVLDQCAAAMGEDETYNFVATYVLIDAMHGAMEASND